VADHRESFIVYIACDPAALFWTGVGLLPLIADAVLPEPMTALGAGTLVNIPDFQQLMDGTAERLQFIVSGVNDETLRLAFDDAPSVRNALAWLGRITFDKDWQQTGPIEWEAMFQARELTISRTSDGNATSQAISLTVVGGDSARSRSINSYFTDADQRRRSPTDAIFSHVAGITAGTSRRWGPR
jgi:hypothetical protein